VVFYGLEAFGGIDGSIAAVGCGLDGLASPTSFLTNLTNRSDSIFK
jgi:hypothetical protein